MSKEMGLGDTVYAKSYDERPVDKEISAYERQKKALTEVNIEKLRLELAAYRAEANGKSMAFFMQDSHDSKRLTNNLNGERLFKPGAGWAAHHIVSGGHKSAVNARLMMARVQIRIDDSDNGCWMPDTKPCARGTKYPHAVPHANIHRDTYYAWVESVLAGGKTTGLAKAILNTIRTQLLHGNIKKEILQEIEDSRYKNQLKTWDKNKRQVSV